MDDFQASGRFVNGPHETFRTVDEIKNLETESPPTGHRLRLLRGLRKLSAFTH